MKNRGVEIYMCPLDEINNDDIHSIIELQGIDDKAIRHTLIAIHKMMKNLAIGSAFSINHLVRAAYLISQNIKRSQPSVQIIRDISIDTYVRCLNGNLKQSAILEINHLLEENLIISNEFCCPNLKTLDISQSSSLCYIKQQCDILQQYEHFGDTTIEDLLLCFFGRSSSSDIAIRSQWLSMHLYIDEAYKNFIKQPPNLEFDKLKFMTKSVDHIIDSEDMPYDFRYLPDIYFNNGLPISDTDAYAENKIHLMLDHALNQALDENFASTKIPTKSN